jgi:hypothetical protein
MNPQTGVEHRLRCVAPWLLVAAMLAGTAHADLLEDMETRTEQGVIEIRLVFNVPVRYLKHFPAENGELLKVYLQIVGLNKPTDEELRGYKRSAAMPQVPSYTVTYTTARNCFATREPLCLDIQFSQPVHYRLRPGEDGRSLLIHLLPESDKPKTPEKP